MIILIPSYQPDNKLINFVHTIKEKSTSQILIVDDGSGSKYDNIFNYLESIDCNVIRYSKNKGKGAALKTGFKYLLDNNIINDVITADGDGQHTIEDILNLSTKLEKSQDEIILGVRKFLGKVPIKNYIGNMITKVFFQISTGIKIQDTQTGLRGFKYNMLNWLLNIKGDRFEYEFNMLLGAKQGGYKLSEVEIQTIYLDDNKSSHFRPVTDSIRIYLPLLKFTLSSVSSALIDFILLILFETITNNLLFSVVTSRMLSSTFNYISNKNLVFDNKNNIEKSFSRYFSLVVIILTLNYSLMYMFTSILSINIILSKIMTEFILFSFSYVAQKRFVFV